MLSLLNDQTWSSTIIKQIRLSEVGCNKPNLVTLHESGYLSLIAFIGVTAVDTII